MRGLRNAVPTASAYVQELFLLQYLTSYLSIWQLLRIWWTERNGLSEKRWVSDSQVFPVIEVVKVLVSIQTVFLDLHGQNKKNSRSALIQESNSRSWPYLTLCVLNVLDCFYRWKANKQTNKRNSCWVELGNAWRKEGQKSWRKRLEIRTALFATHPT